MTDPIKGDGVVFALVLDRAGAGHPLDSDGVNNWQPADGPLWVTLDWKDESSEPWLLAQGIDPLLVDALMDAGTRPRLVVVRDQALVILRGVNLNPGADPDDMVALRLLIDGDRVITIRRRTVMAVEDIRRELLEGRGPRSNGDLLAALADRLIERMAPCLEGLDRRVDELEVEPSGRDIARLRTELAELRRQTIALRRYLAPQREVLSRLQIERLPWLEAEHRGLLRETAERLVRHVEDLDVLRERALVARDEQATRLSEQMNRTMYMLSLVAAVFLPLGLLTGLLGINVGGMPGVESPWAFLMVCLLLFVLAILEFFYLRRRGLV